MICQSLLAALLIPCAIISALSTTGWDFPPNTLRNYDGRMAKLSDCCCYSAWKEFAQPILDAMKYYNQVKLDFRGEFKNRSVSKFPSKTPHDFVVDVARSVYIERERARLYLDEALKTGKSKIEIPASCCPEERESRNWTLLQMFCEGGELMSCRQRGETDEGSCQCFDLPEGKPMYEMVKEDGHCKAKSNTTCNGEDPLISALCQKKLICVNFTRKACNFAFGQDFHCDGISGEGGGRSLSLGKQNLFCSPRLNEPESLKDIGKQNCAHAADTSYIFIYLLNISIGFLALFLPKINKIQ